MTIVEKLPVARTLQPGSTGWTAADLNIPAIERIWEREHYEIVEGVLATMAPAYFDGSAALDAVGLLLQLHFRQAGEDWKSAHEPDVILSPTRVVKPDLVFLSPADQIRQKTENAKRGKKRLTYGRLLLPPSLVIESLSIDHETHDTHTKRRWYAEFNIPNYWLLNAYTRKLECLVLDGPDYRLDIAGKGNATLRPSAFPSLVIPLKTIWAA